jgi:recombination protein RecA
MFGNPETTTGGNALKFYASLRLEVRKIETLSRGTDNPYGNRVRVKIVKNKVAPPFKKVEMEIHFGKGLSATSSLLDAALEQNLIQKSGSWYSYNEEKIGQGRDNVKEFLDGRPEIYAVLDKKVRTLLFPEKVQKEKVQKEKVQKEEVQKEEVQKEEPKAKKIDA